LRVARYLKESGALWRQQFDDLRLAKSTFC
jgi:hypothetical protein